MFALVDCNNFYASCERVFNPRLEGQPVVVLSNNDGCIIARSNEAKKLGIPMGAPFFKWQGFCKNKKVHVFSSNYELYADMSQRIMRSLNHFCTQMEIYSIDEAFLRLDPSVNLIDHVSEIRHRIKMWTGMPVSIGVGQTKTLAKIANWIAKNQTADGVYHLTDLAQLAFFPVDKIWGIGRQLSQKLKKLNIHTAADLASCDPKRLRRYFNVVMEKMIAELKGESCLPLELVQPRKQIISSRSFGGKVTQLAELEEAISHYAAKACIKLRNQKSVALCVNVFLQTSLFNPHKPIYGNSTTVRLPRPTSSTPEIIFFAKQCLGRIYKEGYVYQKAGIILMDISPNQVKQRDLLFEDSTRSDLLMKTVDAINASFGKESVFYLAEGIERAWQNKRNRISARYTTHWNELPIAHCV